MGITGLLPFLEKSSRKTNIREFAGGTVAIDSYCWLHKGVFSCAEKLIMGETTNAYVFYCMKYINMLLKYKIKPILVFDGQQLPAKKQTEIKRRESRETNRRKATELIQMGQVTEGKNLLKRAINITHEIALELIKRCQKENIDCIVAPYEADAQLAYLNINGIADIVITEDSDLTLFGCKKIFFKMDFYGNGVLIEQDKLHLAMDVRPEHFNMDKFRYICILSGCDYLSSLPGIGLGKARKFITRNTDHDIHRALARLGSVLNMKSLVVTEEYRNAFILADITFRHQLVFCPLQRKQVRLNTPTPDITEDQLRYAGNELDADLALQLAFGNCEPSTFKKLHDFNPDKVERKRKRDIQRDQTAINHNSIWSNKYELRTKNHISFENTDIPISISRKKLILQRDSLKDEFVSPKLHISPTIQNDKLSENLKLNEENILDMYNCQNFKSVTSPKRSPDQSLHTKNNSSPELSTKKNPFVKRVSDIMTSPSVLSNGNCRKRGRNLMRIRQTVIDENAIVESKYFSKLDNEKCVFKLETDIEDINSLQKDKQLLRSTNYNLIPELNTDMYDTNTNKKQLMLKNEQNTETLSVKNLKENLGYMDVINEANNLKNQNRNAMNSYGNVSEKLCPDSNVTGTLLTAQCTIDTNHLKSPDNLLILSSPNLESANNLIDHRNVSNLQNSLFKWSNIKDHEIPHKRLENFKEGSSINLTSRVNFVTKQMHQNKQKSSVPNRQHLLSMYGFQKRSALKH